MEVNVRDQISLVPLSHTSAHLANTKRLHLSLVGPFPKALIAPVANPDPLIHR